MVVEVGQEQGKIASTHGAMNGISRPLVLYRVQSHLSKFLGDFETD